MVIRSRPQRKSQAEYFNLDLRLSPRPPRVRLPRRSLMRRRERPNPGSGCETIRFLREDAKGRVCRFQPALLSPSMVEGAAPPGKSGGPPFWQGLFSFLVPRRSLKGDTGQNFLPESCFGNSPQNSANRNRIFPSYWLSVKKRHFRCAEYGEKVVRSQKIGRMDHFRGCEENRHPHQLLP